jgi:transcription antitermination factor NusG
MSMSAVFGQDPSGGIYPRMEWTEVRWYAAYTRANHEKSVAEQLCVRSVENFLPLYASMRKWKDRRVKLDLPLFPGYVFVRLAIRDRLRVQQVPGVVRLVGFGGTPAELPTEDVEALQLGLARGIHAEPHPYLTLGRRVRLTSGPLGGMHGILLRRKGNFRVVVSLELIQRSVVVDVDVADIEPLINETDR